MLAGEDRLRESIVIVDYGMGNHGSVQNMLRRIGCEARITSSPADIEKADKLILPGVGAFDLAMENLKRLQLVSLLKRKVLGEETPILGICLGMQIMSERSDEGILPGLGWVEGETIHFRFNSDCLDRDLKVPHMGWNTIERRQASILLGEPEEDERFYFVHSYHVRFAHEENVLAVTRYGISFTSAFICGNIMGTQFHPEKSHRFGMKILKSFAGYSYARK